MSKYIGDVSAYAYAVSKGYTGTEEEFAELMADYADVGQRAEDAAESALNSKTAAQTAAQTATTKAGEASTSATSASGSASAASASASAASESATQAANSATAASGSATSAAGSATTASTKASEASASATGAATAKTGAEAAQSAAETAQGKAEDAQEAAEDAAESVSASAAQIATNTTDITQLKADLTHKANTDGSYDTLTAGNAKQLLSNIEQTDMVPYNYRTAGGSLEIGDREKLKKIVGGSLAVNQLAKALVDGNYSKDSGTAVYDNGTVSFTAGAKYGALMCTTSKELVEYHKYLISAKIKMTSQPSTNTVRLGVGHTGYNQGAIYVPSTASVTSFTEVSGVVQYSYGTNPTNNYLFLQDNRAEVSQIDMKDLMLIDLTQMFGTTIADYVYSLETATAGAGVAWLKAHFPRIFNAGYIPYNAGTLEHVSGLSAHKMVGFNQWDEEWEVGAYSSTDGGKVSSSGRIRCKNKIPVIAGATYYVKAPNSLQMYRYDADGNYISWISGAQNQTITFADSVHYITFNCAANSGETYNHDICINLHWDGERDGEYEPYEEHSYPLDSDVTLRGIPKLDANNNLYYDGDEYVADGTVTRKYGIVDLGTLSYNSPSDNRYYTGTIASLIHKKDGMMNIACAKFKASASLSVIYDITDGMWVSSQGNISFSKGNYATSADFKAAMSGVYLVYELETPTTESADPYTEIQNVSNWGTEEFVSECLVPVGHETAYQPDLRAKIEVAPESPVTDGVYIMQRDNGLNSYVALASSATIQDIIARLEALEGGNT